MKQIFQKLMNLKKTDYIVFILLGVLVLILFIPTGSSEKTSQTYLQGLDGDEVTGSQIETELAALLSKMEGVGKVSVMVTFSDSRDTSSVEGVLVVAQGGGDSRVASNISAAVQALFDIPAHKIRIAKMIS